MVAEDSCVEQEDMGDTPLAGMTVGTALEQGMELQMKGEALSLEP